MLKDLTDSADPVIKGADRRARLQPWLDESRALIKLATPLIAMQLAQIGSLTADIIMVGKLGSDSLAAIGIGSVLFYLTWLTGYGPVAAISPIIAQILGAHPDDRARVRASLRMGLWAVALLSLPLMLFLVWAKPILIFLGQEPRIAAIAEPWVHAVALGLPFTLGFGALRGFATAIGRQNAVLVIAIAQVLINIAGNYVLIYGHFGAPALGVMGSGIASTIAFAFSFFAMLGVCVFGRSFRKYRILHRFWRPDRARLFEVFHLGVPMGLSMIFEAMLFNAATLIMGTFGAASVAAHQIALNLGSITFMIPLGIGLAATVRVGHFVGARDIEGARRAGRTAILCGAGFLLACAVVMALIPRSLVGIYLAIDDPANAEVVGLAVTFLYVAAVFQLFDALQVTAQMSLRGMKDAQAPMWIAGMSYWLVGFSLSWGLSKWAGLEGLGVWIGLAAGLGAAGIGMVWRFERLTHRELAG